MNHPGSPSDRARNGHVLRTDPARPDDRAWISALGLIPGSEEDMPMHLSDGHVHTEWSWDAAAGSMERSCARAVELGLPSIAFTEHVDFTAWLIAPEVTAENGPFDAAWAGPDGRFRPPLREAPGYLACVQRCREQFPGLRIVSGAELGEPHGMSSRSRPCWARGALTGCWDLCTPWLRMNPGWWITTCLTGLNLVN